MSPMCRAKADSYPLLRLPMKPYELYNPSRISHIAYTVPVVQLVRFL